jgi:predicted ATPase
LRTAAFNLALKRITEKAQFWPVRIARFSYEEITGIGSGSFIPRSPLTVITGKNSVGKTTFLRSLWLALDPAAARNSSLTKRKIRSGRVDITIIKNGKEYQKKVLVEDMNGEEVEAEIIVVHIDSAEAIGDLQQKMFRLGEVLDIINGAPERILEKTDLDQVSYINRRSYSQVKIYEVEVEAGLIAPFFKISYGDQKYDATQMGTGEYAGLFLWWTLSSSEKGSIILIEEPETFLSNLNQESVLKFLVAIIEKKNLCLIMTSHSGHMLHNMPVDSVQFLQRSGPNSVIVEDPDPTALEAVGIYLKPDIFVYVEDQVAQTIGQMVIEHFNPQLARRCQLESVGGEALITKALEGISKNPFGLRFVGWYDGDQKGQLPEKVEKWAALLPGDLAIETILRMQTYADPAALGQALGTKRVQEVLDSLEGEDAHDWLWRFGKALGRDSESVLSAMFNLWLADEKNAEHAKERFDAFEKIATRSAAFTEVT